MRAISDGTEEGPHPASLAGHDLAGHDLAGHDLAGHDLTGHVSRRNNGVFCRRESGDLSKIDFAGTVVERVARQADA
jgi:hypothetical protein